MHSTSRSVQTQQFETDSLKDMFDTFPVNKQVSK